MEYQINIMGCDDETYFDIELTEEEYKLIKKISKMSDENSSCSCQPVLFIYSNK